MKHVDLAQLGLPDGHPDAEPRPRPSSKTEVQVHLLEVTFDGEYGWTSVHRTPEGARARLEEKVDAYDARADFDAIAFRPDGTFLYAAGEEGARVSYGITVLPVEE